MRTMTIVVLIYFDLLIVFQCLHVILSALLHREILPLLPIAALLWQCCSQVAPRCAGEGSTLGLEPAFISNAVSLACLNPPRPLELMTRRLTSHPVHKSRGN